MAKKQLRLDTPDIIRKKLPELSGKKVNIVMISGRVVFVKIEGVSVDKLQVSDMRLTKSQLDIDQISEIILDIEV